MIVLILEWLIQWELEHLFDILHHFFVAHNVLVLVLVVVLLASRTVDVIVPVADEEALVEERPVRTEERESLASQISVCTHAKHLASRVQVCIIA